MNFTIKPTTFLFLITTLAVPSLSFAGPGHDHNHKTGHSHSHHASPNRITSPKELIAAASKRLITLVKEKNLVSGKPLATAWLHISEESKSIHKTGSGYSILKFEDKKQDKTLFILISDSGEVYDANFSGKFDGLTG